LEAGQGGASRPAKRQDLEAGRLAGGGEGDAWRRVRGGAWRPVRAARRGRPSDRTSRLGDRPLRAGRRAEAAGVAPSWGGLMAASDGEDDSRLEAASGPGLTRGRRC
jgi:hypothetical protein